MWRVDSRKAREEAGGLVSRPGPGDMVELQRPVYGVKVYICANLIF